MIQEKIEIEDDSSQNATSFLNILQKFSLVKINKTKFNKKYQENLNTIEDIQIVVSQELEQFEKELNQFGSLFTQLQGLQKFTLTIYHCKQAIDIITFLSKVIPQLSNLKQFTLIFGNGNLFEAKHTQQICEVIKQFQLIDYLSLTFCDQIGNQSESNLISEINQLKQLKQLELVFYQNAKISNHEVKQITNALTQLPNLIELQITIEKGTFNEQEFQILIEKICSYKNLVKLGFQMLNFNYLSEQIYIQLGISLQNLINLEQLTLAISQQSQLDIYDFISQGISQLRNLKVLILSISRQSGYSNFQIGQDQYQLNLQYCIQNLKQLTILKIRYINKKKEKVFIETRKCPRLVDLKINY